MKKPLPLVLLGVLLGLFIAWLLGLFSPVPMLAPAPSPKAAGAAPPVALSPTPARQPSRALVAAPVLAPAKVSPTPPAATATPAAQQAAEEELRQKARVKAITNNLRQLLTASQQYMLDKGVTSASYYDLVGAGTDSYIRNVSSVAGEDYSGIYISQSDTEVMVNTPDGTTVTYHF